MGAILVKKQTKKTNAVPSNVAVFRAQFGAVARAASQYNGVWYSVVRYGAL